MLRVALPILLLMLLEACSPVALLNALAPRAGVTIQRDISYGPGPYRVLDVYAPSEPQAGAPVVVFFYGGSWDSGDRGMYRFLGAALAARGIVAVIPDYRRYPEVGFPAFVEDGAAAVAWARTHGSQLGGDPGRLFLMGHSAGAQIAALLALDQSYLQAQGLETCALSGFIGLAGPYDFLPLRSSRLQTIFGPEQDWPRSQPINYVSAAAPPMLLIAGSDDTIVDPANTVRLAARLRQAGAEVEEHVYRGVGHKAVIGAFGRMLGFLAPVRRDLLSFIARHSAEPRCAARSGDPGSHAASPFKPALQGWQN
jgi:acetyl esterase/lipase